MTGCGEMKSISATQRGIISLFLYLSHYAIHTPILEDKRFSKNYPDMKGKLLAYATPDQAAALHDEILERAEALIADLGLAYRIVGRAFRTTLNGDIDPERFQLSYGGEALPTTARRARKIVVLLLIIYPA